MEILKKISLPPWLALVLGVPAMVSMAVLCRTGLDANRLFDHSHPAVLLLWLLTGALILLVVLAVRPLTGKLRYSRLFPASSDGALGLIGATAAVAWSGLTIIWGEVSGLETAVGILGLVSALALGYLTWCRYTGQPHSILAWALVTFYLLLRLLVSYRTWSSQTDLLHFFFPLLASVTMALAFYHRGAFILGMGSRRMYLGCTQICAFCSLVTLGASFDIFYAGAVLWSLLDVCTIRSHREKPREEGV